MKFVGILVLLVGSGVLAVFPAQATAQFEIDPDHFDQMGLAKADGHIAKSQKSHKQSAAKRQHKPSTVATKRHQDAAGPRQAKAASQPLAMNAQKGNEQLR